MWGRKKWLSALLSRRKLTPHWPKGGSQYFQKSDVNWSQIWTLWIIRPIFQSPGWNLERLLRFRGWWEDRTAELPEIISVAMFWHKTSPCDDNNNFFLKKKTLARLQSSKSNPPDIRNAFKTHFQISNRQADLILNVFLTSYTKLLLLVFYSFVFKGGGAWGSGGGIHASAMAKFFLQTGNRLERAFWCQSARSWWFCSYYHCLRLAFRK